MSYRHNVFVSFHHANDWKYRLEFEQLFSDTYEVVVNRSVQLGDIDEHTSTDRVRQRIRDEYLRDSTVTVVLIGSETWKRKHVDWEISSSIRQSQFSSRSGLLGIILPTYPRPLNAPNGYNPRTIPPRLDDNVECGFAKLYNWSEDPNKVAEWIHDAFTRRNSLICLPNNARPSYAKNRSGLSWQQ